MNDLSIVTDVRKHNVEDTLIGTFIFIIKHNDVRYVDSTNLPDHFDLICLIVFSRLCFD